MPIQGHLNQDKAFLVPIASTEVNGGIQLLKCRHLVLFKKPWDVFCLASSCQIKRTWRDPVSFCPTFVCQMLKSIWNVSGCLHFHNWISSLVNKYSQESFSVDQIYLSASGCAEYFYRLHYRKGFHWLWWDHEHLPPRCIPTLQILNLHTWMCSWILPLSVDVWINKQIPLSGLSSVF